MSDTYSVEVLPLDANVRAWVEDASADPVLYRRRQVTEIVLTAIGLTSSLKELLVLKGGTLMAIAFQSQRLTGDVDFSATCPPEGFEELLRFELQDSLPKAAIKLGYLDLICAIQGIKKRPRPENFEDHDFPALEVRVASAVRGTAQEKALERGAAAEVALLEITFKDQVFAFQQLMLLDAGVAVRAFTINEIISEKLRAFLQQEIRNRNRRQDIYDIAYLLKDHQLSADDRLAILKILMKKSVSRGIEPTQKSLSDPKLIRRARRDWHTMKIELGVLPNFDDCFRTVQAFYESLPWNSLRK